MSKRKKSRWLFASPFESQAYIDYFYRKIVDNAGMAKGRPVAFSRIDDPNSFDVKIPRKGDPENAECVPGLPAGDREYDRCVLGVWESRALARSPQDPQEEVKASAPIIHERDR
jgi:hypothetical protein